MIPVSFTYTYEPKDGDALDLIIESDVNEDGDDIVEIFAYHPVTGMDMMRKLPASVKSAIIEQAIQEAVDSGEVVHDRPTPSWYL